MLQAKQVVGDAGQRDPQVRVEQVEPAWQLERLGGEARVLCLPHPFDRHPQRERERLHLGRGDVDPLAELQVADVGRDQDRFVGAGRFADAKPEFVEPAAHELGERFGCHAVSVSH